MKTGDELKENTQVRSRYRRSLENHKRKGWRNMVCES